MKLQTNYYTWVQRIFVPISLAALLLLGGCTDEQMNVPTPNGEEKMITLSLTTPKSFIAATYANPPAVDEDKIQTIDVLVFDDAGKYFSGPHYASLENVGGTPVEVTLRIPQDTPAGSTLAVFANSRKVIYGVATSFSISDDEETTLKKIVLDDKAATSQWETFESKNLIPMYGEVAMADIATASATLVRMVANINVTLGADALSNFTLNTVHLYNRNSQGYVASHLGPLSSLDTDAVEYGVTSNKSDKEIYAFETTVASTTDFSIGNACIVIGGNYNGDTSKEYYYRIDFYGKKTNDPSNSYLPLTRNYRYSVSVVKIFGPGCNSAAEAATSKPANLQYEVKTWDEVSIIYGE